jgi:Ca2+-transporting ATPase
MTAEGVIEALRTHGKDGLNEAAVAELRRQYGKNALTPKKGKGPLTRLLLQFHAPLVYILIAAGATTALLGEYIDASVIFGVVLVNAVVGFIQEAKALTAIDSLARALSRTATVLRGGVQRDIEAEDLVPGDIVLLQSGDKVPADMRLIRTRDMLLDESALTGESVPVEKSPGDLPSDTALADRENMAYSSTLVTYGTGRGIVTATGDRSEVGRISTMIASAPEVETPLTKRISRFSNILLVVIVILAALTFGIGMLRGAPWLETLLAAVALAVGAIPEGLPAAVTVMLAIGVSRMAKRRAIIRKLPAVETLGSTTIICTDKTGTLTHNQMTVREIAAGGVEYRVTGEGYEPTGVIEQEGEKRGKSENIALTEILSSGALCNDATLNDDGERWIVEGDPTEGALLTSALKAGLDYRELSSTLPRLDAIPFESAYQYMATLHSDGARGANGVLRIYLKGAVEKVLARCDQALGADGQTIPLDADAIRKRTEALASRGRRVLALAKKKMPADTTTLTHDDVAASCTFLGFQAMIDPPREEAARAVARCRRAGIVVKMITGDHATTAAAIAREVGIIDADESGHTQRAYTGRELEAMDDDTLAEAALSSNVFARVTPESKLKLVQALQKRGHVVAMTGDGVNDAPAVRTADIGVAMALGGTEVAREAAAMVLTDDNFATIEAAVREGRGIFDNLVKFIAWTLPTNMGEGLVLLTAVVLGTGLPILPVQVLWINMTTVVTLGTMLAFEPSGKNIMRRAPRAPKSPLMDRAMLFHIALVSALICIGAFIIFQWEMARGAPLPAAQTAAAGFIVFADILYLLSCRSFERFFLAMNPFSNPWIWLGIASMMLLQGLFTYLPVMNHLFHTTPLEVQSWERIALLGGAFIIAAEAGKLLSRLLAPPPALRSA